MKRIDRESIQWLSAQGKQALRNLHDQRIIHNTGVIFDIDFYDPLDKLYEALYQHKGEDRVFSITNTTKRRVWNMNISSLTEREHGLDLVLQGIDYEVGTLVCEDAACAYAIFEGKKLLMVVYIGLQPIGYVGYGFGDGEPICEIIPYHLYSGMLRNQFPESRDCAKRAEPVFEAFKQDLHGKDAPEGWLTRRKAKSKTLKSARYIQDFFDKQDLTEFMLKTLIFMKTSEVYSKEFVPDPTPAYKRKKGYRPLNYISVDTTWDMDIDVNTPFPVRGHFVHQPYKVNGEWSRKLIYVEQYMKKGYHRKATKTKYE